MAKKLSGLLSEVVKGRVNEPRLAEVSSHFFAIAGGPKRVAQLLYEEFVASKPGSIIRQRILDMILRMTKFANERSGGDLDDLSQLSEDDLRNNLAEVLKDLAQSNASEEEETTDGA